jgi:predicted transcriptional regulator
VPYARISVTLPKDVLAAADRRAKQLDRPRSWVIAEALRQWEAASAPAGAPRALRDAAAPPYGAGEVAEARQQHLIADLRRTPAERLRSAADLAGLAQARRRSGPRVQIIGFDSYEDFYEWKKARRAGA